MTRNEFMAALRTRLAGLPEQDMQKSLAYYGEMIDDCTEDGMSEEEAVASMGDPEEIAQQILADIPLGRLVKERIRPKRKLQAWEIVLLILGSPVWLSLLIAAAAVILSLFVAFVAVLLSVVACLWALGASFAGISMGGVLVVAQMLWQGFVPQGICCIGAILLSACLAVLMYFASLYTTIGCAKLVKRTVVCGVRQWRKGGRKDA